MTDPIADMLTRIRNANTVGHDRVEIPGSKLKLEIARVLHEEGYIRNYRWIDTHQNQGLLRIYLKYGEKKEKVIAGLKRVSKPGRRVYAKSDGLPRVQGNLGIAILSTSQGIKTASVCRKSGIGGEVLCYIW